MILVIIIGAVTCLSMIAGVLFFPQIKIKRIRVDSYWIIALIGAIIMIAAGGVGIKYLFSELTKDSAINPIKILVLFISMTMLSVFLDEVGFFRYLASKTLKKAGNSQTKLFIWLYMIVSILTVFTSNDIIVLTFTPFICYFAKNAKINPLPYLINEFIAANTMSMTLIIGNPTNIYIASSYGINFIEYLKIMILPTLASAIVAFFVLYLLFFKQLKKPVQGQTEDVKIENKSYLIIGLVHLIICAVMLAIGPYIGVDMWIVSLASAVSLFIIVLIISIIRKTKPIEVIKTTKRAPWQLIPFVLSMFTVILAFKEADITGKISELLAGGNTVFKYGIISFLSANIINNIPMSVLFSAVIEPLSGSGQMQAIYATIMGSNIGAFLTPIGALAGIMFSSLLKEQEVKFSYLSFMKYGCIISIPTILSGLGVLALII